jgi:hypothetical protein
VSLSRRRCDGKDHESHQQDSTTDGVHACLLSPERPGRPR